MRYRYHGWCHRSSSRKRRAAAERTSANETKSSGGRKEDAGVSGMVGVDAGEAEAEAGRDDGGAGEADDDDEDDRAAETEDRLGVGSFGNSCKLDAIEWPVPVEF